MNILVTGARGFVGRNLCAQLNNIKNGKARCYGDLKIDEVFEYDLDSTSEQLDVWCQKAGFVFNLAGVNRPKDNEEFMKGNFGFAGTLLDTLKKHHNTCHNAKAVSKEKSLALLAEYFAVPIGQIVAFGDNYNDIGMLSSAGLGVAVGNAHEVVKSASDMVTDKNIFDGVAKCLKIIFDIC